MPLKVLFVRHGESQANLDQMFANRVGIPGDLTPAGVAQAHALAESLAPEPVTHVYTSPLDRARQTAEIIAKTLGVPATITDALREYDVGDFEGKPYSGSDAWRWERYERIERAWRDGQHEARHSEGESLFDLRDRFLPFMDRLVEHHDKSEILIAVGHGGLFRAVLPFLFASLPSPEVYAQPLRHGDMVVAVHDRGTWRCEGWGEQQASGAG
ncbi:MAG TPA: histidine phosphatase family protein [Thermomicrobiales bacterium]|nr:histidine phosphatase family protein [Thermomicrobiales bacterium]